MNHDLLNILSNSNKDIDNQQLMDYLAGKLTTAQAHDFEKNLRDDAFTNDALEGLENFKDKQKLELLVAQLNRDLNAKLKERKKYKEKRRIKNQPYVYVGIVVILALAVLAYFVVSRLKGW
jgi:hypothetical protein